MGHCWRLVDADTGEVLAHTHVKIEAGVVVTKVASTNLLLAGTLATPTLTAGPTATQGVATADFFPANP